MPAEGLNLDHMIAKCAHCHAVFRFEIEGQAPAGPPERERANVAQPDGFTVEDHGRVLIISRRWRSGCAIAFFSVFALVWNGFVWSIYWLPGAPVGIFNLFLVPFQLVGLGLAYLVAALFVNSTTITKRKQTATSPCCTFPKVIRFFLKGNVKKINDEDFK